MYWKVNFGPHHPSYQTPPLPATTPTLCSATKTPFLFPHFHISCIRSDHKFCVVNSIYNFSSSRSPTPLSAFPPFLPLHCFLPVVPSGHNTASSSNLFTLDLVCQTSKQQKESGKQPLLLPAQKQNVKLPWTCRHLVFFSTAHYQKLYLFSSLLFWAFFYQLR